MKMEEMEMEPLRFEIDGLPFLNLNLRFQQLPDRYTGMADLN